MLKDDVPLCLWGCKSRTFEYLRIFKKIDTSDVSQQGLWKLQDFSLKEKTRIRRENPSVTGEALVSKDEGVEGVNSGRWAKENYLLEVCFFTLH